MGILRICGVSPAKGGGAANAGSDAGREPGLGLSYGPVGFHKGETILNEEKFQI